jgi:hypothetical protein
MCTAPQAAGPPRAPVPWGSKGYQGILFIVCRYCVQDMLGILEEQNLIYVYLDLKFDIKIVSENIFILHTVCSLSNLGYCAFFWFITRVLVELSISILSFI